MLMSGLEQPSSGRGIYIKDGEESTLESLRANIGFYLPAVSLVTRINRA